MTRTLYRGLLSLHPRGFRKQFSEEMLWIFDEGAGLHGRAALVRDCLTSLLRQWLLRHATLKIVGALVGGLVYISVGLLLAASAFTW